MECRASQFVTAIGSSAPVVVVGRGGGGYEREVFE